METSLKRLSIPRAYQAVYLALQSEILSGRIAVGEVLPTETDLAKRFGVTRHTIREGMRVLEQSGLVKRDAGRRLHATLPHHNALAPRASRALLMLQITFRELWEIAWRLEVYAVELAMPNIDDDVLSRLDDNLAMMERNLNEGKAIIDLDVEFHTIIAEATRNRVLLLSREPVSLLFYPSLKTLFDHSSTRVLGPQRLLAAHQKIVRALHNRDKESAIEWMNKHMADFRRGYNYAKISLDEPVDVEFARIGTVGQFG